MGWANDREWLRPRLRLVAAAAALLTAAASCTNTERVARGPIGTVDELVTSLARVMCGWQFRCCSVPDLVALGNSPLPQYAECVEITRLTLGEKLAAAGASVAMRRSSVEPTRAAACLEIFEARACNQGQNDLGFSGSSLLWNLLGRCLDPFVGRVAVGETCFLSNECAPGSRCLPAGGPFDDGTGGVTPEGLRLSQLLGGLTSVVGVCHAYRGEGDRCALTEECDPSRNLYCRRTDFRCAIAAQAGQACSSEFDPLTGIVRPVIACDTTAGLTCRGGLCRLPPRNGEPCLEIGLSFDQCDPTAEPPLHCVGEEFNGTGTCKAPGLVGAACGGSGLPPCDLSLACLGNLIGTCGLTPTVGQPCSIDLRCLPPAVCHLGENRCVLPGDGASGSACSSDADCASLFCGFTPSLSETVCATTPDVPIICAGPGATPVLGGQGLPPVDGGFVPGLDAGFDGAPATSVAVSNPAPGP